MEKIKNFIDNMFFGLRESPKMLQAKEDLQGMMEDKFQELTASGKSEHEAIGQVFGEFGNLEELAEDLGIEQELQEVKTGTSKSNFLENTNSPYVMSNSEAEQYMLDNINHSWKIALGVFLFIISSVGIIVQGGYYEALEVSPSNLQMLPGLIFLFVSIIIGVGLLTISGIQLSKWNFLSTRNIALPYQLTQQLKQKREEETSGFALSVAAGIGLIFLGVIALIVIGAIFEHNVFYQAIGVAIMLALIGAGVFVFILSGMRRGNLNRLLNLEEYSPEGREEESLMNRISGPYWLVVVGIYLAWSFIFRAWSISWLVFPIAGIIYAIIRSIVISRK